MSDYPEMGYVIGPDTIARPVNKRWIGTQSRAVQRRLRDLRKGAGLTQTDLARQLGKPQSFVAKYENGERELSFAEAVYVSMAIGLDAHSLVEFLLDRAAGRRKSSSKRSPTQDETSAVSRRRSVSSKRSRATAIRNKSRSRRQRD